MAFQEILPADSLLMDRGTVEWVVSVEALGDAGVVKPLDDTLGDELADGLGGVAVVIVVVESYA